MSLEKQYAEYAKQQEEHLRRLQQSDHPLNDIDELCAQVRAAATRHALTVDQVIAILSVHKH